MVAIIEKVANSRKEILLSMHSSAELELANMEAVLTSIDDYIKLLEAKDNTVDSTKVWKSKIIDLQELQKKQAGEEFILDKLEKEKENELRRATSDCYESKSKFNLKNFSLIYKMSKKTDSVQHTIVEEITRLLLAKADLDSTDIDSVWDSIDTLVGKMAVFDPSAVLEEIARSAHEKLKPIVDSLDPLKNSKAKDKIDHFLLGQWALSSCILVNTTQQLKQIKASKKNV